MHRFNLWRMNSVARIALIVAALAFAAERAIADPPVATLETSAPSKVPAIAASLQPFIDRGDLAGAVTLVAQHGQLVHLDSEYRHAFQQAAGAALEAQ